MKASFFVLFFMSSMALANQPNPNLTPGYVCTPQDKDYTGMAYPSQVAICQRNVSQGEKMKISAEYGIPTSSWRNVEFDHLIPLCAGGSNDIRNVWPEALDHAHLKDVVENQVCVSLREGKINQKQAADTLFQWLRAHPIE